MISITKRIIFLFSLFIILCSCGNDFKLSQSDKCVIIIPNNAGITERFSAEELQKYLTEITDNEEIDILRENEIDAKAKKLIYIGQTEHNIELAEEISGKDIESFIISGRRNRLVLIGNCERATLYAVYTFLEQQGCRWLAPGIDHIPQKDNISMKSGIQIHAPGIKYRVLRLPISGSLGEWKRQSIDWAVKNKINMVAVSGLMTKLPEEIMKRGSVRGINGTHVSGRILTKELYEKHPEIFARDKNGEAILNPATQQFCFSSDNSVSVFADKIIEYIDYHPEVELFPITQADGGRYCECDDCLKLYGEMKLYHGVSHYYTNTYNVTKAWMTFAEKVAEKVNQVWPDKKFYTLASYLTVDPTDMDYQMDNNIIVVIPHVQSLFDYFHKYTEGMREDFPDLLKRWSLIAPGGVGIYDHYPFSKFKSLPLVAIEKVAADIKTVYNLGCPYFEMQSVISPGMYLPVYYAAARTMWDPFVDLDNEMSLFYKGMYGKSAAYVEKFFKLLEEARETYPHPYNYELEFGDLLSYLSKEVVDEAEVILEKAVESVSSANTIERLQPIVDHFSYVKYLRRGRDAYALYKDTGDIKYLQQAVNNGDKIMELVEQVQNYEGLKDNLGILSKGILSEGRSGIGKELKIWRSELNEGKSDHN